MNSGADLIDQGLMSLATFIIGVLLARVISVEDSRLIEILNEIGFDDSTRLAFDRDIEDIRALEFDFYAENTVVAEGRKH